MVKKIIFLLIYISTTTLSLKAQVYIDSLNKQAKDMVHAGVVGDYKTLLKFTHPKIVKIMGGDEKALKFLKETMQSLQQQHLIIQKAEMGNVVQLIKSENNIQCIIPQTLTIVIGDKTALSKNFLFGISYNEGKQWYFLDTAASTEETYRKQFPEMSKDLIIPKSITTYN